MRTCGTLHWVLCAFVLWCVATCCFVSMYWGVDSASVRRYMRATGSRRPQTPLNQHQARPTVQNVSGPTTPAPAATRPRLPAPTRPPGAHVERTPRPARGNHTAAPPRRKSPPRRQGRAAVAMVFILVRRESAGVRDVFRRIFAGSGVRFMFVLGTCCLVPDASREEYTCDAAANRAPATNAERLRRSRECASEDAAIQAHVAQYGDMLVSNATDVYRNLPAKVRFMLQWGVHNTDCDYFVKVDEDHFVSPAALSQFVSLQPRDAYSVVGEIVTGGGVNRDGKWRELTYRRGSPAATYPRFPLGSRGWIMSRQVAAHLALHARHLFDYQGEDVSVGIWLDESSIAGRVQWISSPNMRGDGNCLAPGALVVGHQLSPEHIRQCWDKRSTTGLNA